MDNIKTSQKLKRAASPESAGVDSQAVLDFLDCCEKENIELHSFMLLRHGKVAAEAWWKPFNAKTPHTMFSFSKSVSSTAIGFAIEEGRLSLDTKVYDLFPEYAPRIKKRYENMLTVEHLLKMSSGKMPSFLYNTEKVGWVRSYLRAPFKYMPGEKFEYVTENSFMLTAIIRKVTGLNTVDYLKPRLFEPLGIDTPVWETNQSGIETGGWGLYLKTEDQAKFCQCYLNNGKWGDKQVIPEFWTKTAGEKHIDNSPGISPDRTAGYGYQFWLNSLPNSYRCDGLFSQFGIIMKDYDACIVTSAGEPVEQKFLDAIWKYFPKAFSDEPLPENPEANEKLKTKIAGLGLPCLPEKMRRTWLETKINGRLIKFRNAKFATVLGLANNAISPKRSGDFNNVRLYFEKDRLKLFWTEKYDENTIEAGFNGKYIISKGKLAGMTYNFAACCAWLDNGSLEVWIRPLEHSQARKFNFTFEGQTVELKCTVEKGLYDLALFGFDFKGVRADDFLLRLTKGATNAFEPIVEPNLKGRFV